jgi:hypothetical protein
MADAARLSGFSQPTIKRMFQHEAGVHKLDRPSTKNKRRYCSIRIPRGVYERVIGRITNK